MICRAPSAAIGMRRGHEENRKQETENRKQGKANDRASGRRAEDGALLTVRIGRVDRRAALEEQRYAVGVALPRCNVQRGGAGRWHAFSVHRADLIGAALPEMPPQA